MGLPHFYLPTLTFSANLGIECKIFWTNFFNNSKTTCSIEMKRWPSQQNYPRNIYRLKLDPFHSFYSCTNDLATLYRHFQYLAFYIDFLMYKVGDMLRPWNFLKNVFSHKKLIRDIILKLHWCKQKLVSGLYITHQSRDLVNEITNCHLFIRWISGTSFNWNTRGMTYAPLYTHNILEKSVHWKLWY